MGVFGVFQSLFRPPSFLAFSRPLLNRVLVVPRPLFDLFQNPFQGNTLGFPCLKIGILGFFQTAFQATAFWPLPETLLAKSTISTPFQAPKVCLLASSRPFSKPSDELFGLVHTPFRAPNSAFWPSSPLPGTKKFFSFKLGLFASFLLKMNFVCHLLSFNPAFLLPVKQQPALAHLSTSILQGAFGL